MHQFMNGHGNRCREGETQHPDQQRIEPNHDSRHHHKQVHRREGNEAGDGETDQQHRIRPWRMSEINIPDSHRLPLPLTRISRKHVRRRMPFDGEPHDQTCHGAYRKARE